MYNKWKTVRERGVKALQNQGKCDKLTVKDGWLTCPVCKRNKRLLRVAPDTEAKGLRIYCTDCKTELVLDIDRGQSVERRSP